MLLRSREVFQESRKSLRIKENLGVKWKIKDSQFTGEGKVLNISTSGMLVEARSGFSPIDRCVFDFESFVKGEGNFLPQEGRLVWSKKAGFRKKKMLCGIEFIEPTAETLSGLRERVQNGITKIANARKVKSIIGTILFIVMLVMSAFIVKQHAENYYSLQLSHKNMISAYQNQATLSQIYSKELKSTKKMLSEAEQLLAATQTEKAELQAMVEANKVQLAQMGKERAEFEMAMVQLNSNNAELNSQIQVLKEKLRVLEVNINSIDEGKSLLSLFRGKMRTVKVQMKNLKREARLARVAAQKEKDRIGFLMGNNGYFVKDGRPYEPKSASGVEVNVEFYK